MRIESFALSMAFLLACFAASFSAPGFAKSKHELPSPDYEAEFGHLDMHSPAKVELGRLLFFDKVLSGNANISCATCHHALTDTGDGLSLPVGEGGRGLGVTRDTGTGDAAVLERVPRNAPPVFNLGAAQFAVMFHDGRVQHNPAFPSSCETPAGNLLPEGLDSVLACQAMFPVTSPTEMAGQPDENAIGLAAGAGDVVEVWRLIAERLSGIGEYVDLFMQAYPGDIQGPADITYAHAANAIAAFEAVAWRADDSPFDRYLRGDKQAMSKSARRGMRLFYGKAGCAACHSGLFQTDQAFHAIAMPQIGPGKGDGFGGHEDFGREQVTLDAGDRYRFRTPPLRNVALTAPYGHDGAYDTLEAVVRHHLDPAAALEAYDTTQARLPSDPALDPIDFLVHDDPASRTAIANANELAPVDLSEAEINRLIEFLQALTDPASLDLRRDVPDAVPSGLPLAE